MDFLRRVLTCGAADDCSCPDCKRSCPDCDCSCLYFIFDCFDWRCHDCDHHCSCPDCKCSLPEFCWSCPDCDRPCPGITFWSKCQYCDSPTNGQFRTEDVSMQCPHCRKDITTVRKYVTGNMTWFCCCICVWYGLCCFPFCCNQCKDCVHRCPECDKELGRYERM